MKKASEKSSTRTKVRKYDKSKLRECPTCDGEGEIKDRRRDFGSTMLIDIARKADLDPSSVSRIFSRSANPKTPRDTTFNKAAKIAEYLGVTLDELHLMLKEKQKQKQ